MEEKCRQKWKGREEAKISTTPECGSCYKGTRYGVEAWPCVIADVYPCEARIEIQGEERKAMADQIATVSKQRLKSRLTSLSLADVSAIERAIRVQLGLS